MGNLVHYLGFIGIFMVAGLPLTFFAAVLGGLLWALLKRLPGWFFPAALGLCLVILGATLVWAGRVDDDTDIGAVVPHVVLPLNLAIAVPSLLVGWALWWYRRDRKLKEAQARNARKPDSVSAARLP